MSDLIDAAMAKEMLGCDEATLSNYINNGNLRAQRVDGQLMILREDVEALASGGGRESSDSILVLDGESEDLSIDLGEISDDGDTMMDGGKAPTNTEQITFGEELEVVTFDDPTSGTGSLPEDAEATISFDETANTENLSFTESNTAIVTDVDETMGVEATSEYQTVESDFDDDDDAPAGASVRRSVRSQRLREEEPQVGAIWVLIAALNLIVAAILIAPYYFLAATPKESETLANGDRAFGVDDIVFVDIAEGIVGFSLEPDPERYQEMRPDGVHIPYDEVFPGQPNTWFHRNFLKGRDNYDKRSQDFIIGKVDVKTDEDGRTVIPVIGHVYERDENNMITSDQPIHSFEYQSKPVEGQNDLVEWYPNVKYNTGN